MYTTKWREEKKKNKRRKIKEEEETNEKEKKLIKIVSSTRLRNATRLNSPPQVENITDGGKKHGKKLKVTRKSLTAEEVRE